MSPGGRHDRADSAALPRLSRALLLPGPLPPHTHFGVTLLRHVVLTGLRSALHRLGLPLIRSAPLRVVDLRLYLDRAGLSSGLGDAAGAAEAVAALTEPAGAAAASAAASRLSGAAAVHRLRLLAPPRRPRARPEPGAAPSWRRFRAALSTLLPALSDALLAELVASLTRRRARAAGRAQPPCLGREAWRWRRGAGGRLDCLGPPEPLLPSWATEPERAAAARRSLAATPIPPRHRYRGRFRESYRAALDILAGEYRQLAEQAAARGVVGEPSDAFFLPLDVAEELTAERRPSWLAAAVAANRREYMALQGQPSPPDRIGEGAVPAGPAEWQLSPLAPLD